MSNETLIILRSRVYENTYMCFIADLNSNMLRINFTLTGNWLNDLIPLCI